MLGKKCISLTLPGLEPEPLKQNKLINLDTHIQFVVDYVLKEDIADIILCGHSYAGTGTLRLFIARIIS